MWKQFLKKVRLIDRLEVTCNYGSTKLELQVIKLGSFRVGKKLDHETLSIKWSHEGNRIRAYDDALSINVPKELARKWSVRVEFKSPMIRERISGTSQNQTVHVTDGC